MSDGEYRKTCSNCHGRGNQIFARIYPERINGEWTWLCKKCWEEADGNRKKETNMDELQPKQIKRHADKLLSKARTHTVILDDPRFGRYRVISGGSGSEYIVNVFQSGGASCNCDWARKRQDALVENKGATACSHTIAVFEFVARGEGKRVSAWTSEEEAARQHRPVVDMVDGIVLTKRVAPKRYVQSDFLFLVR